MAYLEANGLTKVYGRGDRATAALRGIDLSVERGEFVAIVGQSGAGKSTLMNLLGCLDTPTAGGYQLDGQETATMSRQRLAAVRNREIGFVFQQFHLIGTLDALENVELPLLYRGMPRSERRRRAEACLVQMGLGDRLHHKPTELSGGQQQRVAIARAVAGDPPLLLADEPTGNLDAACAAEVMDALRTLHRAGHTILLITHDAALAASCPRCIRLQNGQLIEDNR